MNTKSIILSLMLLNAPAVGVYASEASGSASETPNSVAFEDAVVPGDDLLTSTNQDDAIVPETTSKAAMLFQGLKYLSDLDKQYEFVKNTTPHAPVLIYFMSTCLDCQGAGFLAALGASLYLEKMRTFRPKND